MPNKIYLRRLSCLVCKNDCQHFGIAPTYTPSEQLIYSFPPNEDSNNWAANEQENKDRSPLDIYIRRRKRRRLIIESHDESTYQVKEDSFILTEDDGTLQNVSENSSQILRSEKSPLGSYDTDDELNIF